MNFRFLVTSRWMFVCLLGVAGALLAMESRGDEHEPGATRAVDSMVGKKAGEERTDNGLKLKLVWCPPGKFRMGGQPSLKERVEVTFTKGFWLGKYELTQQEYQQINGNNPSYFSVDGEGRQDVAGQDTAQFPVEQVNWHDAVEFCRKLTDRERHAGRLPDGWEYTLPTEAQWEYACRARTSTKYSFGDKLSARDANVAADGKRTLAGSAPEGVELARTTTTVGSYSANRWGLCDMHGNAWEWCRDWYGDLPGGADPEVTTHPPGAEDRSTHIIRGGGWVCLAFDCDSALRRGGLPDWRYKFLGFRIALNAAR